MSPALYLLARNLAVFPWSFPVFPFREDDSLPYYVITVGLSAIVLIILMYMVSIRLRKEALHDPYDIVMSQRLLRTLAHASLYHVGMCSPIFCISPRRRDRDKKLYGTSLSSGFGTINIARLACLIDIHDPR
jgi:hypothetical protein